jgi:ribonuclease HI
MYFDGSLKLQGAGAGILFIAPGGEQLKYALQLLFPTSNNAVEYEALIHGLSIDVSLSIKEADGIWRFASGHKLDKQRLGLLN